MRYRDRDGTRRHESTGTTDWKEANQKLRDRLQARDGNILDVVRKGEQLVFGEWAEAFLDNYTRPPLRARKTHEANVRGVMHLTRAFGAWKLADLSAEAIEEYLRRRLRQRVRRKPRAGSSRGIS